MLHTSSVRAAIWSSTGTVNLRVVLYAAGVVKDVLDGLFAQKAVSCSCGLLMDLHYRRGWVWALGCCCFYAGWVCLRERHGWEGCLVFLASYLGVMDRGFVDCLLLCERRGMPNWLLDGAIEGTASANSYCQEEDGQKKCGRRVGTVI